MPCYHPLKAYRAPGGGVVFSAKRGYVDRPVDLPCGQCSGCRLKRSKDWALRAVHEAQLHEHNCFITLTYDQDHLPEDLSVNVRHWQLFAKRLRKAYGPFRYLHCGEYGDHNYRPHYHACLFGIDFSKDRVLWKKDGANESFVSPALNEIWGQGFTTLGHLTKQSAAYVARYVMKKVTGPMAEEHYRRLDHATGEEWSVKPEYVTMSRRPGLGREWLAKFKNDVYPDDEVIQDGERHRPPRFYDYVLEAEDPELLERIKEKRREAISKEEFTPDRLDAKEQIHNSKINQLKRNL